MGYKTLTLLLLIYHRLCDAAISTLVFKTRVNLQEVLSTLKFDENYLIFFDDISL